MVANAAHSIGKPYRVRTARRRVKQPQISIGLNGRPNDTPTMCTAMCLAMRRAGARVACSKHPCGSKTEGHAVLYWRL